MRIAIVDPSLFTLPYDAHLCEGLAQAGHEVRLYGRHLRPGELAGTSALAPFFYSLSEKLPRAGKNSSRLRNVVKPLEHVFDTLRLLRELRRFRPDVVHYQWMPIPAVDR